MDLVDGAGDDAITKLHAQTAGSNNVQLDDTAAPGAAGNSEAHR